MLTASVRRTLRRFSRTRTPPFVRTPPSSPLRSRPTGKRSHSNTMYPNSLSLNAKSVLPPKSKNSRHRVVLWMRTRTRRTMSRYSSHSLCYCTHAHMAYASLPTTMIISFGQHYVCYEGELRASVIKASTHPNKVPLWGVYVSFAPILCARSIRVDEQENAALR